MERDGLNRLVEEYEATLARQGVDGVTEKQLIFLTWHRIARLEEKQSRPPWASWKPRDIATAALVCLVALGIVGGDAVTRALELMG